jgi:hypothetical protein
VVVVIGSVGDPPVQDETTTMAASAAARRRMALIETRTVGANQSNREPVSSRGPMA